jgi:peptidoglycan/LPS O-acetylase OafA/YrhL
MLLMLMAVSSLLLLAAAGVCFRGESKTLTDVRRVLFLLGVAGCAVSAVVLLVFLLHAYRAAHGTTPVDLDRLYPVFWMLGLGALAALLAFFGRRLSRLLLLGAGLLAVITWYLAALAVSP